MRKSIVAVIFFMAMSVGVFAQGRGGGFERMSPEQRAEMQTKRLTESLSLTADQQKKVLALNLDRIKKSEQLGREEGDKRKELRETYDKELNAILTEEQKVKMNEQREKMKANQQERRGPRDGAPSRGGRPEKPKKP